MLILLSPAKTLSFNNTIPNLNQPSLLERSTELIKTLRTYNHADLKRLMKLSDSLAQTNLERYQSWRGEALKRRRPRWDLGRRGTRRQTLRGRGRREQERRAGMRRCGCE